MLVLGYFLYKIWKDWPVLIQRHKVSFQFSLYFLATISLCKISPVKNKVVFTGNIEIYYENGERALLIIGLSNIYVWGLQYLYLPSQEGLMGK
jgi:hypothetical protein